MTIQTPAQKYRQQNIAKVKVELHRIQAAVKSFEHDTANLPEWNWTGDWAALKHQLAETREQVETCATMARNEREATR